MRQRCANRKLRSWPRYGGRGITVCEHWRVYAHFLADMGERPPGTSLDRFPNGDGNYEPGNCRWATPTQQARSVPRKPSSPVGRPSLGAKARSRVVSVALSEAEYDAIVAQVAKENAELVADGNGDGTTATVSSWMRDHALDPLGLATYEGDPL